LAPAAAAAALDNKAPLELAERSFFASSASSSSSSSSSSSIDVARFSRAWPSQQQHLPLLPLPRLGARAESAVTSRAGFETCGRDQAEAARSWGSFVVSLCVSFFFLFALLPFSPRKSDQRRVGQRNKEGSTPIKRRAGRAAASAANTLASKQAAQKR
jgi:hypothetical protein